MTGTTRLTGTGMVEAAVDAVPDLQGRILRPHRTWFFFNYSIEREISTGSIPFVALCIAGLFYACGKIIPGISGSALLMLISVLQAKKNYILASNKLIINQNEKGKNAPVSYESAKNNSLKQEFICLISKIK